MTDKNSPPAGGRVKIAAAALSGTSEIAHASIAELRDMVEAYAKPDIVTIVDPLTNTAAKAVVVNGAVRAVPASLFDDYLDSPRRRTGTAAMLSLDSLIAHAMRFKDDGSALFADPTREAPSITAVIDYHPSGAECDVSPRFGRHRATYAYPLSDEWQAWIGQNGKPLSMAEFAEFLEDRITDVVHLIPDEDELSEDLRKFIAAGGSDGHIATPQKLIELSRGLSVNENSVVREVRRLDSGEAQILFTSEHTDANGEQLRVPNLFLIAIPVFQHGALYRLAARLRYRKTPSGIVFWYDLWRTDRTFDHAFRESCERAQIETDLPLFYGRPEC